jgi:glutamate N-acetyltransferase/amino-acid N-acetyltransferase
MKQLATRHSLEILADGTVTTPAGFAAAGIHVGVRDDWSKLDVGVLVSESGCSAAATYTSNRVKAAPLVLTQQHLAGGTLRGVVVNSGCANAATGEKGMEDAVRMAEAAGARLGLDPQELAVASTGVIGTYLPMDRIVRGIDGMTPARDGGFDFAVSIMTTDTVPKYVAVRHERWTVGVVCKGVGMIHPNMATMLCFLTTDARVEDAFLQRSLREAVDASFNMVDIDSDTSTNDMALILANGASGAEKIDGQHPDAEAFREAVRLACTQMARKMVHDAEGGTKLIEVTVTGAESPGDARLAARSVVSSLGVKTAVYGQDPNWGRILAAVGNSGAEFDEAAAVVSLVHPVQGPVVLFANGAPAEYDDATARACLAPADVGISIELDRGQGSATAWGSDLTEEFVRLNSVYTT